MKISNARSLYQRKERQYKMNVMKNNPAAILKIPSYPLWLSARLCANFAKLMQALIVYWQVYDLAKSPLALGFIGLAEAVPFIAIGLWAGHFADRYDKRIQIAGSVGGLFLCSIALLVLSLSPTPSVIPIYIVMAITGVLSSFEFVSSWAYVQTIVDKEDFPRASAWNLSLYQLATIGGPLLGGWIVARYGVSAGYGAAAFLFLLSSVLSSRLRKLPVAEKAEDEGPIKSILGGLQFLSQKRLILACMMLDMVGVLFGDAVAIMPVFAELFKVGPIGLGVLRSATAIGSLVLSTAQAWRPFVRIRWTYFLLAVGIYGVCMVGFGLSTHFYLSLAFLIGSGFADGVSVIIRQSVFQANTPDEMKGRVASVSSIFIRLSNEMGAFESGLAAHLMGAARSVVFGGAMTLAAVAGARGWFGNLDKTGSTSKS
jgi:MFS family permease